jgi:betaine lipid synthase
VIPPFHGAVDRAITYLDKEEGLLGVCDFYTSSKFDLPLRQVGGSVWGWMELGL